jgi:hypothetical protein
MLHHWLSDLRARLGMPVTRTVRGMRVEVLNNREDIDDERLFARLEGALDVIERHQPWRFRRLRRDVAVIWIRRWPCRAAYVPQARACLLDTTFVANPSFSEAQIAASIVHEAVHARLDRMGVHAGEGERAREERLCRRAELELGLAVPDGGPVVERALAAMALADQEVAPEIDWVEAERRVAQVDQEAARAADGARRGGGAR